MSELPKEMRDAELEDDADAICARLDEIFFEIVGRELDRVREARQTTSRSEADILASAS